MANSEWPNYADTHTVASFRSRPEVPAHERRLADEMAREVEREHATRVAQSFPLAERTARMLAEAARQRITVLDALDVHLDHIRNAPVVETIFGSRRMAPLTPDPDRDDTFPVEKCDPVAYPELSIVPNMPIMRATLRMMIDTCERIEPLAADSLTNPDPLLATQRLHPRHAPGYVSLAEGARRTSALRESLYRCECYVQESKWDHQVAELTDIIDYLDPHARERTLDYMVVSAKMSAAFQMLASNRTEGFLAWSRACLQWIWMFLQDLREWLGRRADGSDRADGTDFPFADLLNQPPDIMDIPKPAEYRDALGR
ncbi:MAG TPA: hypothetical protein VG317_13405 [Pseudonocardiaceae bacterium]|nr:hypothetical protein [Pseudonocardiaceae bacterium]